ncbi:MAG: extracellular solute-binding protein [Micrococcales bacterium]|nr:extracellular solute-binding protein [Micrococcales bacterium]
MAPSPLTRRQLLLGGTALLGTAGLAGCAGSATDPTLQFWHLLSGGDGTRMSGLIDRLNARGSGYRLKPTVLAWGAPYYTKLAMASAGGRAPDVAIMHASRVAGYAPGGLLDNWDRGELESRGVDASTFPERIWKKGFSGGNLFSVALDAHPFILMYNTDIAEKAGVLGSDGQLAEITSPEQFLETAKAIGGVAKGNPVSYGYLGDGAQMWRMFYTFYRQQGATMTLTPGRKAEYDEEAAVKSLAFMQQILDGKIAAKGGDYGTAVAEFSTGKSGMLFTGVWELPTMEAAKLPFDAQPIPTLFGTPAAYADSHAFVLPRQANADPVRRKATYDFVADILKISYDWAMAGHIPAYLPVTTTPKYAKLLPQAHYAGAAKIINYDPEAWFTGSGSNFQGYFAQYVQGVLLGGDDPAAGFRGFINRVNTLLGQPNPVDKGR